MTNAQKWILTFLTLFVVLSVITWVTYDNEPASNNMGAMMQQGDMQENEGLALANKIGCTNCHGGDLKGGNMAPSLVSAKDYWKRNDLINYLRNPESYGNNERILRYKEQYRSVMPAYENIDVKDLGKIADYILNLK